MSYDKPRFETEILLAAHDFGATADTVHKFNGPVGKAGRLMDYGIRNCTEVGVGSSTAPSVAIGNSSDPDAYGEELDLTGAALNADYTVRSTYDPVADAASFDALMVGEEIPADTTVYMTLTQGVGGTPAGIGLPYLRIWWQD